MYSLLSFQLDQASIPLKTFLRFFLKFSVDASAAGDGHVTVKVNGQTSHPYVDISAKSGNCYTAIFEPQEAGKHQAYVLFNDIQIPGYEFCLFLVIYLLASVWSAVLSLRMDFEKFCITFKIKNSSYFAFFLLKLYFLVVHRSADVEWRLTILPNQFA